MKVTVRTRKNTDGTTERLFLDINQDGKRTRRVLDLFIYSKPTGKKKLTKEQAEHNETALLAADKERNKVETDLLNGADIKHKTKAATLKELTDVYLSDKERATNTALTFYQMLRYVDGTTSTATLDTDKVNELYKQINKVKDISTNTKLLYRSKLDAVIRYGIKNGYCRVGILEQADEKQQAKKRERVALTAEELNKLVADYTTNGKNWKRVFLFSCFTGLRYSDIVALRWERPSKCKDESFAYIDGDNIKVVTQKTDTFISIPLSEQAKQLLPTRHGDNVFKVPDVSSIRKTLLAWCKVQGINKAVSFHTARHTFATLALNNGVELLTVSKLLGHHNISTTQIYIEVLEETKQQAVNVLDNLIKTKE